MLTDKELMYYFNFLIFFFIVQFKFIITQQVTQVLCTYESSTFFNNYYNGDWRLKLKRIFSCFI